MYNNNNNMYTHTQILFDRSKTRENENSNSSTVPCHTTEDTPMENECLMSAAQDATLRGTLALNNMAVHLMEKEQPSKAVQLMKNALRVNYGLCLEVSNNISRNTEEARLPVSPQQNTRAPSATRSPSTTTYCNTSNISRYQEQASQDQNCMGCSNGQTKNDRKQIILINNMMRNSTFGSNDETNTRSTPPSAAPMPNQPRHINEDQLLQSLPFKVKAIECDDCKSLLSAIDPNCPNRELTFHPIYVRDSKMENPRFPSPQVHHRHTSRNPLHPAHSRIEENDRSQQKLCGILFYNLGIACYMEHLLRTRSHISGIPPVLIGNVLIQLDHPSEANLALEMANLIFSSLMRHNRGLSDDVCLTLTSVLSLSLIHRFQQNADLAAALETQFTIAQVWNAINQDEFITTIFTANEGNVAPAG